MAASSCCVSYESSCFISMVRAMLFDCDVFGCCVVLFLKDVAHLRDSDLLALLGIGLIFWVFCYFL